MVRGLPRRKTLDFLSVLMEQPELEVAWVDEGLHRRAMRLLEAPIDKTYSLCDAVSFELMRQRGETEALTTDHHFEQEGFVRLLRP
jgi:predicted nucleic acid-binding protein